MDELDRLLNRVGKSVFVRYYVRFADQRIPDSEIVEMLPRDYTLKSRRSRTSKARRIFRERRQREALERIADSQRTDSEATALARRLLTSLHD
jgi:hypothetical protein